MAQMIVLTVPHKHLTYYISRYTWKRCNSLSLSSRPEATSLRCESGYGVSEIASPHPTTCSITEERKPHFRGQLNNIYEKACEFCFVRLKWVEPIKV
jgi:hypothetical protein